MNKHVDFSILKGLTLTDVKTSEDEIIFIAGDRKFRMCHFQDCCESVFIESIVGDLKDLIGNPLLIAEESSSSNENPEGATIPDWQDSFTWTFYKLATIKGSVDIRWYGGSNGYYSESVDLVEVNK